MIAGTMSLYAVLYIAVVVAIVAGSVGYALGHDRALDDIERRSDPTP